MLRTKTKLRLARALNRATLAARKIAGRGPIVVAHRGGVKWKLDLNEGIDLAIYLGLYQKIPKRVLRSFVGSTSLAIDIGANIGSHTLQLAREIGKGGLVVAVEPTDFAFSKLVSNINLNPSLSPHVVPIHGALGDGTKEADQSAFYSRWPVGEDNLAQHPEHGGRFEAASGARYTTLDLLLDEMRANQGGPSKVGIIKLDVDGNELSVLRGACKTLARDAPVLFVEIAPHIQDEVPERFEAMLELLASLGYRLEEAETGAPLPGSAARLRRMIKFGASKDVVARRG